ncbi:hypothetical protein SDC9_170574 [bioreactor metagenome]|uniref:Uncharacterized protein n=1 Tax=bioreactor metagenome TaxID=1076179 RepID=A0A645GAN3_9ZZZZ
MVFQGRKSKGFPESTIHLAFAEAGGGSQFSGIEVIEVQFVQKRFNPEHARVHSLNRGFKKRISQKVRQHQFMELRVHGKFLILHLKNLCKQSPARIEVRRSKDNRQFSEGFQRSVVLKPYFVMDIHHFKVGGDIHREWSERRYGNHVSGFDGIRMPVKMNGRPASGDVQQMGVVIDLDFVDIAFSGMIYINKGNELEFMSSQKFMIHSRQTVFTAGRRLGGAGL